MDNFFYLVDKKRENTVYFRRGHIATLGADKDKLASGWEGEKEPDQWQWKYAIGSTIRGQHISDPSGSNHDTSLGLGGLCVSESSLVLLATVLLGPG